MTQARLPHQRPLIIRPRCPRCGSPPVGTSGSFIRRAICSNGDCAVFEWDTTVPEGWTTGPTVVRLQP